MPRKQSKTPKTPGPVPMGTVAILFVTRRGKQYVHTFAPGKTKLAAHPDGSIRISGGFTIDKELFIHNR